MDTSVIIAAAGSSSRMQGIDKQLSLLGNIPIIGHSMLAFENLDEISDIVIVTKEDKISTIIEIADTLNIKKFTHAVSGGNTRQESVTAALKYISKDTKYLAVHDGARPLVDSDDIKKAIKDAHIFGCSVLGVRVKDTIKMVDDSLITDTIPRNKLYSIQTPQIFRKSIYYDGLNFTATHNLEFTDDCQVVEAIGGKIYVTDGNYSNIKITTPEDLIIAENLLNGSVKLK